MPADATIHLIDDDEAVRESLAFLLATAEFRTLAYDSASAFLAALPVSAPAVVVTDVRMPGVTGLMLLRELRERAPDLPVIVMTGHADVPLAVEAMKQGAVDFLEKPFDDATLLAAIGNALAARPASEEAREILARIDALTPRERQVLDGLVAGHANKRIAHELAISPRTVEIYRANVMTKMRAASLSELVRMALAVGLGGA